MQAVDQFDRLMTAASLACQLELSQPPQHRLRCDPERCLIIHYEHGMRAGHASSVTRKAAPAEGAGLRSAGEDSIPASACRLVLAEIEQDRLDPAIHIPLLAQAKLREDRVRVLLNRTLGDEQCRGDR